MPTLTKTNGKKTASGNGKTRTNNDYKVKDLTLADITNPRGVGPQLLVEDGGDATLLLQQGYKLEHGSDWVNTDSASHEEDVIKKLLKRCAKERPGWFTAAVKEWKGVSEETTTG